MKVAFVTHWLSSTGGGVSAAVEALSGAFDPSGVEVSVLGLADEAWSQESVRWSGARAEAFPVTGPRALGFSYSLRCTLKTRDPDIVHSHGIWMHTSADVLACARRRKPYLVSPHGMLNSWALSHSSTKKRLARMLYEDHHLRGAACIHALCEAEVEAIRAFGLVNPICVIPNGVQIPTPAKKPPAPWAKELEQGAPVLLYLGRLHPKKNIHGLLEALALIKSNHRLGNWRVAIAGWDQGSYGDKLACLAKERGLDKDVFFLGPVFGSKKEAALRNASAFILPSLSEGLPMAVLEAWAFGLPVAMTSACNLPEGLKAGAAQEVSAEPRNLASDLDSFLNMNEGDLAAMGQRGFSLAKQRFSWESVAAQFIAVYNCILGGGVLVGY